MDDLIWYDITCHTAGCRFANVTIYGQGPAETAFLCGPCGQMISDWKVSENQTGQELPEPELTKLDIEKLKAELIASASQSNETQSQVIETTE